MKLVSPKLPLAAWDSFPGRSTVIYDLFNSKEPHFKQSARFKPPNFVHFDFKTDSAGSILNHIANLEKLDTSVRFFQKKKEK